MLPLRFFADPRFTVASLGVGLVFFAMMGSVFAFTQFLQFAHGYSALEAGAAMLPLALGLVVGSGASNQARRRASAARGSSPAGWSAWRAVLSTSLLWTPEMAPALLALVTFGLALSMGFGDGAGDRLGHERGARGQGRRRLGDERRHPPGRRRARRRRDRLAHRHRLLQRHGRRAGLARESIGAAHATAQQLGGAAGASSPRPPAARSPTRSASASPPPRPSPWPARCSSPSSSRAAARST